MSHRLGMLIATSPVYVGTSLRKILQAQDSLPLKTTFHINRSSTILHYILRLLIACNGKITILYYIYYAYMYMSFYTNKHSLEYPCTELYIHTCFDMFFTYIYAYVYL